MQSFNHSRGELTHAFLVLDASFDDLVIYVCDVANISHLVTTGLEPTLDDIKCHHRTRVANVTQVINGHAAHVHLQMPINQWAKILKRRTERVVNSKCHENLAEIERLRLTLKKPLKAARG